MFSFFKNVFFLIDCGKYPKIPNSRNYVKKYTTVNATLKLVAEVQYTCNTNYRKKPSTASGTYVCEIGGAFTYTEFVCLKGIYI